MWSVVNEKPDDIRRSRVRVSRHPLPWRNQPSAGDNHVADANGRPVYDGCDAAEMFRLYVAEAQAEREERSAADHVRGAGRRMGRGRRLRRTS